MEWVVVPVTGFVPCQAAPCGGQGCTVYCTCDHGQIVNVCTCNKGQQTGVVM